MTSTPENSSMFTAHGGRMDHYCRLTGRTPDSIIDFSVNVNPDGLPDFLRAAVHRALNTIDAYPHPFAAPAVEAAAHFHDVSPGQIVFGNGTSQLIHVLPRALQLKNAVIHIPAFSEYETACHAYGTHCLYNDRTLADGTPDVVALVTAAPTAHPETTNSVDVADSSRSKNTGSSASAVFITTPGNPTARAIPPQQLREAAELRPDVWLIVDEAFIDYAPQDYSLLASNESEHPISSADTRAPHKNSSAPHEAPEHPHAATATLPPNCIVLRSLTKFYGAAGLRTGYVVSSEEVATRIRAELPEWSLNSFAISVTEAMFTQGTAFRTVTHADNIRRRNAFAAALATINGVTVFPSDSNFLLFRTPNCNDLFQRLLMNHGIAVRDCRNFRSLEDGTYYRVAVRHEEDNLRLIEALHVELTRTVPHAANSAFIEEITVRTAPKPESSLYSSPSNTTGQTRPTPPKTPSAPLRRVSPVRKPALMLQGTSSNAGKSVLTAAFCRILLQDGYRVAPFKSQNMALNSHVTPDGGEIGRAQAVQAQACRLEPDPRMNPILLKPNTDTGSQVIVMGKAKGNMNVREYFRFKEEAFGMVKDAYDSLADECDVLVLEGAGSPGEVNLKANDIVNMNMARYAASPVLLTGDIDRGGVYASFLGTFATFDRWERDLLAGYLVNRFRGDASLLEPAHEYLMSYTQKPVLGVIPHIEALGLPEEDSVSMRFGNNAGKDDDSLDMALIALPRISNFTDFDPLECEPDVKLRLVRHADELGSPDVIIIPGSKSVISDLTTLQERGLADAIRHHAEQGTWIVGICGGLQMLGRTIADPLGIESATPSIAGIGLIGLETVMEEQKMLTNLQHIQVSSHAALPLPQVNTLNAAANNQGADASGAQQNNSVFPVHGYEIHHGKTTPDADVVITMHREVDKAQATQAPSTGSDMQHTLESAVGFARGNVWTTYLHGVFENDAFRRSFVDAIRTARGLKPAGAVRARYDTEKALNRLADVVRSNVDLESIYTRMGL